MSKKYCSVKNLCCISDVAINSIIAFPRKRGFYQVLGKADDGLVFLEELGRIPQISFCPPLSVVYVVEGF